MLIRHPFYRFYMQYILRLVIPCIVLGGMAACSAPNSAPALPEGTWTGTLTPMNHPEMANPVAYEVRYLEDTLAIDLIGPNDSRITTRAVHLSADSLHYRFDEPEEGVTLQCALGCQSDGRFEGRCTDATGQWARFTMVPPADGSRR